MLRFGEKKSSKRNILCCEKKTINIWDANSDNIVIPKLAETKANSKYLIGCLDKVIAPLVLVLPKMCGYVKTFKVKDKNNKLMPFRINDEKLLEKYKTNWTKIENLKKNKLNALPVYDDSYMKTKIKTYGDEVYTTFRGLNIPEDDIGCESFTVVSINSLLVHENKY